MITRSVCWRACDKAPSAACKAGAATMADKFEVTHTDAEWRKPYA
jgi:hypothetical protein